MSLVPKKPFQSWTSPWRPLFQSTIQSFSAEVTTLLIVSVISQCEMLASAVPRPGIALSAFDLCIRSIVGGGATVNRHWLNFYFVKLAVCMMFEARAISLSNSAPKCINDFLLVFKRLCCVRLFPHET